MDGTETTTAPAPSAPIETETETISAADQAVQNHDPIAYRAARHAERSGAPLAPAPAKVADPAPVDPSAPAAAAPPAPVLSKKQQEANDRTRLAVESATADLQAENARLKAQLAPPKTAPAAVAPPADDPEPTYEQFATEADPFTAHMKALARWEGRQAYKAEQVKAQQDRHREDFYAAQERLDAEGLKAHSDFADKLTALAKSGVVWPADVSMAILRHEKGAELAYALASDPALSQRVTLFDLGVLAASLATPPAVPPVVVATPKLVTDAPAPPTQLGGRPTDELSPTERALMAKDPVAYKAARHAERSAGLGR